MTTDALWSSLEEAQPNYMPVLAFVAAFAVSCWILRAGARYEEMDYDYARKKAARSPRAARLHTRKRVAFVVIGAIGAAGCAFGALMSWSVAGHGSRDEAAALVADFLTSQHDLTLTAPVEAMPGQATTSAVTPGGQEVAVTVTWLPFGATAPDGVEPVTVTVSMPVQDVAKADRS